MTMEYDCGTCPVEGCERRPFAIRIGGKPRKLWTECPLPHPDTKKRSGDRK